MSTAAWAAFVIVGLLAGLGIGFWIGRLQDTGASEKVGELESELEAYRSKVTEHFSTSAQHFQAIGQQYRELYEHMATGSKELCKPGAEDGLAFPQPASVAALASQETELADIEAPATEAADVEPVADVARPETIEAESTEIVEEAADTAVAAQEEGADESVVAAEPPLDAVPEDESVVAVQSGKEGEDADAEQRLYH